MKQYHLLGISQQAVSKIEQSEKLHSVTLDKIAKVIGVNAEAIKSFSEEGIVNYFNTFNDQSSAGAFFSSINLHCNLIP